MAFQPLLNIGRALRERLEAAGFRQVLSAGTSEIRQLRRLLASRGGAPVAVMAFRTVEYDPSALKRILRVLVLISGGVRSDAGRCAEEVRAAATAVLELFRTGAEPVAEIEFLPVSVEFPEDGGENLEYGSIVLEGIEFSR